MVLLLDSTESESSLVLQISFYFKQLRIHERPSKL